MKIICCDAESYFDESYTLSKMTTESYIRDKRFECHGWAVKWNEDTLTRWYDDRQARHLFKQEDWSDIAIIGHHLHFDGLILSHHYGIKPKLYLDTLSCARLLLGNHISVGLDNLAKHFGLAAKTVPYNLFKGKHWHDLDRNTQQEVADGACHDVDLTWQLFKKLGPQIPKEEFTVMDTVIRMFTDPVLRADTDLFARIWETEENEKAARLAALGVAATDLASAEKFAVLLRAEGIEPATKEGKNGPIYSFAKTDPFMEELRESDSLRIRTLAEARLGEKSTLLQTRAESLGWMSTRGALTVYLKYAGAGTLRVSGGDGCLTADTQILTLDISGTLKYKNIVDVLLSDLVWDGEEFVAHEGVAFSGYREVIAWDGIKGTPEHKVFCNEGRKSLREALRSKTPLVDCREPTSWEVEAARSRQRTSARSEMPM